MNLRIEAGWVKTALAASALALLGAAMLFAVPDAADAQSNSLSFDNPPKRAAVTSGTADKNVVKVRASGPDNQKRIRYSISGNSAFRITPKGGRIKYDGSSLTSGSVLLLTVTARDIDGDYEDASFTLHTKVSSSARSTGNQCRKGMKLYDGDRCTTPVSQIELNVRSGANACWFLNKNQGIQCFCIRGGGTVNGLGVASRDGFWVITKIPKKDR